MGKNKNILLTVLLFAVLSLILLPCAPLKAAKGIKLVPSLVDDLVEPGEVLKKNIRVANIAEVPVTMYASVMDFKPKGEKGKTELIRPGSEAGAFMASWINISDEPIEFGPEEEKIISYTISVPEDAGPGGHYGAISFGTKPPRLRPGDAEKGAAVSISQQTVSLVLLQVAGDIVEKAAIKEFYTDKKMYSTPFETKFAIRVENLGNTHIKPRGMIEIKNMFGKKVATVPVNDKESYVIPDSIRKFDSIWRGKSGFGKYEASLALSYGTQVTRGGEGKKTLSMKRYFWVFPVRLMLFSFMGAVIAAGLFTWFLRNYRKKAVARAMKQMGVKEKYSLKKSQSPIRYYISTFLAVLAIVGAVLFIVYFLFI